MQYLGLVIIIVVIALLEVMLSMLTILLVAHNYGMASIMPLLFGNGIIYYSYGYLCDFIAQILRVDVPVDAEDETVETKED